MTGRREYIYVGPAAIREAVRSQAAGSRIASLTELRAWLCAAISERSQPKTFTATFTIDVHGDLYLAPRRSEHVACAAGGPVLSAGEMTFDDEMAVIEITNLSTGFCPEPESWVFVKSALDQIGISHPGRFTTEIVFRRCPSCGERNVVKDEWYYCAYAMRSCLPTGIFHRILSPQYQREPTKPTAT